MISPPDSQRIKEICRRRWTCHILMSFAGMISLCVFFDQRSHAGHRPSSAAALGTSFLALALFVGGDLLWRCPVCRGRLPRGLVGLPRYCSQCAVPLSDPPEGRAHPYQMRRGGGWVLVALLIGLTLLPRALPHHRPAPLLPTAAGEAPQLLTRPTAADADRLRRQLGTVDDLLTEHYPGASLHGTRADFDLLQRLLDDGWLRPDQTQELQCLGIAFGNALAAQTGLHWIMVEDSYGRDPALRYKNTSLIIYPMTMISKRVERGERVNVRGLFEVTRKHLKRLDPGTRGDNDSDPT